MLEESAYLSVVIVSRNDDHGGALIQRMQLFFNSLYEQCNHYKLNTEIILVEWNPPSDKTSIFSEIKWPNDRRYVKTRIIEVPKEIHDRYKFSDKIPLFQMIGKNVGIIRAKGEYILATNVDIIFSDELIEFISKKNLRPHISYRVDRVDLENTILTPWFSSVFIDINIKKYYSSHRTFYRIHTKYGSYNPKSTIEKLNVSILYFRDFLYYRIFEKIHYFGKIHTNACGDFTLLSKEDWIRLRGYIEAETWSWSIDSLLLIFAFSIGVKEQYLCKPYVIYHIEHNAKSGRKAKKTEDLTQIVLEEVGQNQVPIISANDCLTIYEITSNAESPDDIIKYNPQDWGLANENLKEIVIE